MLFSRKSIGVEVNPAGVAFALVGGTKSTPVIERVAFRPLAPGTIRASLRELNLINLKAFSDQLSEAYNLLIHRSKRISISLPDAAGRIMLMDMEGRFKSRDEALDMIRWKLKKNMPFDMSDTHLNYQLLRVRESGGMALLVCLVSKAVIEQYENAFSAAGLNPASIHLNTLNLCHAIEQKLELLGDCALLSFYNNSLGIMVFYDSIPVFLRFKELADSSTLHSRLYSEIQNSLLVYRERFPEHPLLKIACLTHPATAQEFREIVAEATHLEPVLLEAYSGIKLSNDTPSCQKALFPFSAAIGAALRML